MSQVEDTVSVAELAAWRRENTPHMLLDVREAPELAICGIAGAIHIPMGQIPALREELPRDMPLVVMCHHGMRSQRVMQFLRQAGWENAINLEGGIDAWADQIDADMQRY
jgi:rhodanese-related sulfurtransferase